MILRLHNLNIDKEVSRMGTGKTAYLQHVMYCYEQTKISNDMQQYPPATAKIHQ
jgi:hypothetical protein